MIKRFTSYLKNVIKIISKPVMSILPGQLAFSFVLTIIPLIVLLTFIASTFSISLDSITNFVTDNFPEAVGKLLLPLINGRGFDFNILIFLLTAFLLASGGATSIITASDVIYEIKAQKYIPKKIKSFIMTFILIALLIFMFIVPAFGNSILNLLKNIDVFKSISREVLIGYYLLDNS
jgi:membrane protein